MRFIKIFFVIISLAYNASANANANANTDCWVFAAKRFNIEVKLLQAIAQVESRMVPTSIGKNKNGSRDYGLMQINSIHLDRLSKKGISKSMLVSEPCVSLLVGASILKDMVNIYGYGWEAVGAYNAGVAKARYNLRMKYARQVWEVYRNPISEHLDIPLLESHRRMSL